MRQARAFPVIEVAIGAVALALIATTSYFSQRQTETGGPGYDTFSSYDVTPGGYRAWYDLLIREGVRVERFELRPAFLDHSIDVYITASNYREAGTQAEHALEPDVMGAGDWNALATWVKGGGHLVFLTDGYSMPSYMNAPDLRELGPTVDEAVTVAPVGIVAGVRSVFGRSKLRVPFTDGLAAPVIADDTGSVVVTYALGKGEVTVVTDESLFENSRLSRADNAMLADDLATNGITDRGAVAFDEWTHGYVAGDSWWTILPRPFQIAMIAIGAALALLAIGTGFRFGPTARLPDESERTSAEYLTSMAVLYRRGRAVRAAIVEMADACLRHVAGSVGLPDTATARAIANRIGGAKDDERAETVMQLDRLRSYEYPHEADLLHVAQLCASLRKEFTRYARFGIGRRTQSARRTA